MTRVLVVESGAKTRTIRSFLGDEYDVVASGGHIVDLPDDELGVDVADDFAYAVEPINRRGGNAVESMQSKLEGADEVYLATDPDREGEAIAADISEFAVPAGTTVHRIEFNAIVFPAVKAALESPRKIDADRVEAQRARRTLDRLIGFILSSVAKFDPDGPNLPSVGRVQSPAVRLVVDREQEIAEFEPRRYWSLWATVEHDSATFDVTFDEEWDDFSRAKEFVEGVMNAGSMTVAAFDVDPESEQNPLPPYTTDTLQNEADFLLDLPPERTMELAQQLYEGVDIGDDEEDTRALITYMRTDSTRVSPSALNLAKETLVRRDDLGEPMYKGRTWAADSQAQDAHEAIRPTHPEEQAVWPETLEGRLDEDLLALYTLIYKRFLASQMVPAVYRTTTIDLTVQNRTATAVGHELLEPGFLRVWQDIRPDHGRNEVTLPELETGADLPVDRAWPEPEETRPPPRFREGSLVSELKNRGIGRPSTYSEILSKIKRGPGGSGYITKTRGTLRPTEKGESLVAYLADRFPEVVDYDYTARMETDLDRIESGSLGYQEFLRAEFEWLAAPYETATEQGWLDSDRPTPAQLEYLTSLADETDTEIPDDVLVSKEKVSDWIDKLQDEIDPYLRLTNIVETEVGDHDVYRFRLYFNEPLPDDEYAYLRELGFRYTQGDTNHLPGFQFQRQDIDTVEEMWTRLRDRYTAGELDRFDVDIGGAP